MVGSCRLGCFRGLSIDPLRPTGVHPVRGGSCAAAGPAEAGCVACLRGVASRAPRYALARAPARGMQGLSAGESASLLSDWGSEDRGERGRRRHPRGCRAPWPRRSPPPTRGCRRWARRISPSRSLSRSCLLTPRAQVRPSPGAGTRAAHRQNQRLPCGRLAPTTAADVPSYPIAAGPLALPRILRPNARRVAGGAPARRARKGRAGASGAPAHACARSAAEAWGCGWLGSQRWRRRASAPNVANFMKWPPDPSIVTDCCRSRPLPGPSPAISLSALAHPPNSAAGLSDHASARRGARRECAPKPPALGTRIHGLPSSSIRPRDQPEALRGQWGPHSVLGAPATQWRGSWRQGSQGHGGRRGAAHSLNHRLPCGRSSLGHLHGPLGLPRRRRAAVAAPHPRRCHLPAAWRGCQGQGVRGLGVGLAEQGVGRCRRG